jgi:hypothetical protein
MEFNALLITNIPEDCKKGSFSSISGLSGLYNRFVYIYIYIFSDRAVKMISLSVSAVSRGDNYHLLMYDSIPQYDPCNSDLSSTYV